ncbi:MAG: glycosyltransferase [Clostridia bacterium]|nr:glycosyltransferase [Clostridia bacterium]
MEKKICITSPSMVGGGAEKVAANLANYFCSIGYDIDLVLFHKTGPYLRSIDKKINIVDLNLNFVRNALVTGYILPVRKYLKESKPDILLSVIRSTNIIWGLASYGLKLNTRIVFREANTTEGILGSSFIKKYAYLMGMKLSYKQAEMIIANSQDTLNDLIKEKIIGKTPYAVIPNPVLPENYLELSNQGITDFKWPVNKYKIVLGVGRLHKQKNFKLLVNSFKILLNQIPSARLVIIGEGEEKAELNQFISNLGLNDYVTILDFKSNIFPYFRAADLFALSSHYEGFGNVIVEALSVGTPVVATNCPGGPKMILENGKYGMLVKPDDENAFAEALLITLRDPPPKELLIKRAQDFTVRKIAKRYLDILFG